MQQRLFGQPQQCATSDDVFTPPWLFDRMAITFDLDVASPPGGVPWIPATHFYTQADDGLAQPWHGRVWMNPPYSNPAQFVARFIEHGHGVAFVCHSRSNWYHDLWDAADGMVAPKDQSGSLFKFVKNGKPHGIFMPVVLAAIGADCVDAISRVGRVR